MQTRSPLGGAGRAARNSKEQSVLRSRSLPLPFFIILSVPFLVVLQTPHGLSFHSPNPSLAPCHTYPTGNACGIKCSNCWEQPQERRAQAWSRAEKESDPTAFRNVCSDALDTEVARWLMASGVRRLVVGHKPSADCPAVLAGSITGLEVSSTPPPPPPLCLSLPSMTPSNPDLRF